MKKRKWLLLVMAFALLELTACGKLLKDDMILETVEPMLIEEIGEMEEIDTIEILDKQVSDASEDLAVVSLEIKSNDGMAEYTRYYNASFYVAANEEWSFDAIFEVNNEAWGIAPIDGVNEEFISQTLEGENITVGEGEWEIEIGEIKEIVIGEHETNLEEKTDKVIVDLTLESDVVIATGKLTMNYVFTDKWELESISEKDAFTMTMKSDVELEVTEEILIEELMKQEIELNAGTSYEQSLTMSGNEISEFTIDGHRTSDKGRYQIYDCSWNLNKKNATLKLNAEVVYYYIDSDGWVLQPVQIEAELVNMDIVGEWKGYYNDASSDGSVTLTIDDVSPEGIIMGVFEYSPDSPGKHRQPGSYRVEGTIDKSTLFMNLTAGEWVKEDPTALSITKSDIKAYFYVNGEINGLGHEGCPFVVSQ